MQPLEAALAYAGLGFYVFPLQIFSKEPPPGSHGFYDSTIEPLAIESWWSQEPWNIGIDCGRSGIFVIDIDPRNGGSEEWLSAHNLPRSPWFVTTPNGGWHFYYGGTLPKRRLGAGIDLQGAGSYVVAPPSVTLQGSYRYA